MGWRNFSRPAWHFRTIALAVAVGVAPSWAQDSGEPKAARRSPLADAMRELQAQVRELHAALGEVRAEVARYRTENLEMRRELQATRAQLAVAGRVLPEPASLAGSSHSSLASLEGVEAAVGSGNEQGETQRLAKLEEEYQLLSGKVDEQYQTKVESASKYRVRLSGIVLLNLFTNRGGVDNQDFPSLAVARDPLAPGGSFGGTLRQSQLGLEVFGARLAGAKATADLQIDFAGGFANTINGVSSGVMRLRTATLRLDWARTSLVAGQDALFLSPLTPTSLASLAIPAFSYSGNLWSWAPQVRVEHRIGLPGDASLTVQGGILDPLTGEPPAAPYLRLPQGGERARQPGYGTRVAWTRGSDGRLALGVGGYYSRENWGFGRRLDGWAAMTDWSVPLGRWFSLTGEFYRGRAIGGLTGGIGRSVLFDGPLIDPATSVRPLNAMGGWSQLKFTPAAKLEFNAAFGQDNPYARDLRAFAAPQSFFYPTGARNRSSMFNFIYRPRSDLLFSVDYRRLRTFEIRGISRTADHVNLTMGILF